MSSALVEQPVSDLSADISDIINELDGTAVDDLDLTSFLNEDSTSLSDYYQRDLLALAAPSNDPFSLISNQTEHILKPLMSTTASSLYDNTNSMDSQPQYFANNKRSFDTSNATNFELPQPLQIHTPPTLHLGDAKPNIYNIYPPENSPESADSSSPPSSPNSFDESDKPEKESGAKRRKLTAEEKAQKRKQQTRTASKLYRQRRKELEKQLSEKLDALEKEKRALMQEKKAADDMLLKLKEENAKLRQNQKVWSEDTVKTRLDLLVKLQKQLNDNAADPDIKSTVTEINKCNQGCSAIGKCNLMSIINPAAVQQLVAAGFFEQTIKSELNKKGTIEDLVEKIKTEIKTLNADQLEAIDSVVADHNEKLRVILQERDVVSADIVKAFKAFSASKDSKEHLEIVAKLEHLRRSLSDEGKLWGNSLHVIGDNILTPKQHAQFLLKVEFQQSSVKQLSTFWNALNKTFGPAPTTV